MILSATLKGMHKCGQEGRPEWITFEVSEISHSCIPEAGRISSVKWWKIYRDANSFRCPRQQHSEAGPGSSEVIPLK